MSLRLGSAGPSPEDVANANKDTAEEREDESPDQYIGGDFDEQNKGCLKNAGAGSGAGRLEQREGAMRRFAEERRDLDDERVTQADDGADQCCKENGMGSPEPHGYSCTILNWLGGE